MDTPASGTGPEITVVDHPLVAHALTKLRRTETKSPQFRRLVNELVILLGYEATRYLRTRQIDIHTPVAPTIGIELAPPSPVIVPILRAGLGMLDGMTTLLPTADVGFLGMVRDEESLLPTTYADRLPRDLTDREVFVVDPMLATGGTLIASLQAVLDRGAHNVTAICLLGAPEGVERVTASLSGKPVRIVLGSIDERLNDVGYIVPGLGDAGDRLYGMAE